MVKKKNRIYQDNSFPGFEVDQIKDKLLLLLPSNSFSKLLRTPYSSFQTNWLSSLVLVESEKQVNIRKSQVEVQPLKPIQKWSSPPSGQEKINEDAELKGLLCATATAIRKFYIL